jgi:hypothetical protein
MHNNDLFPKAWSVAKKFNWLEYYPIMTQEKSLSCVKSGSVPISKETEWQISIRAYSVIA